MNTFKQFFKEKIETSKGYYYIETVIPGENGPKPVTGKVFTDGEAPDRYVLVRFLMGNKIFTDKLDAVKWMRIYLNSSKINWIKPVINQPTLGKRNIAFLCRQSLNCLTKGSPG